MHHKAMMPQFVLALFDEGDPPASGGTTTTTVAAPPATQPDDPPATEPVRNKDGRFASAEELRRIADNANREAAERRRENKELKKTVDAFSRRAVRSEAKAALVEAGAIDPDVVELFLRHAGDKITLNDDADVEGIPEALEAFKKAKPAFFKAAAGDSSAAGGEGDGGQHKPNATSTGTSPQGTTSTQQSNPGGLPDLRKLTPAERQKALKEYERSVRAQSR